MRSKKTLIIVIILVIVSLVLYFKNKILGTYSIKDLLGKKFPVSSKFGDRIHPITKKATPHTGVDYATPKGTPIFAPFNGVVTSNIDAHGGNQLFLTSATEGIRLGMAHLDSYKVKSGNVVKGQLLAFTGNTGGSTAPHLHLSVTDLQTNKKINPEEIFKV